ncbi:hypothetical protein NPIL_483891 [Nephila pilipes]|uniref:Uncharacterized protein n=1 Tax=Nephila pilipes TaxID=299642 RepID=A0A8X6MR22_NEPPI|nr:hypothetical protein NPIL_483891 [Nephila pilipes]
MTLALSNKMTLEFQECESPSYVSSRYTLNGNRYENEGVVNKCRGKSHVLTKGTFKHDLVIDEDYYSLTCHVVPTKHLNFKAIIGISQQWIQPSFLAIYLPSREKQCPMECVPMKDG